MHETLSCTAFRTNTAHAVKTVSHQQALHHTITPWPSVHSVLATKAGSTSDVQSPTPHPASLWTIPSLRPSYHHLLFPVCLYTPLSCQLLFIWRLLECDDCELLCVAVFLDLLLVHESHHLLLSFLGVGAGWQCCRPIPLATIFGCNYQGFLFATQAARAHSNTSIYHCFFFVISQSAGKYVDIGKLNIDCRVL